MAGQRVGSGGLRERLTGCPPSLRECTLPCRGEQAASGGPFATGQYVLVEPLEEPDRVGLVRLGRCQACATRSGSGELVVLTGDTGEAWR